MLSRLGFSLFLGLLCPATIAAAANKTVASYIETIWLGTPAVRFTAKLDTGARTSSINAAGYERFMKEGKTFVRFNITSAGGETIVIETAQTRTAVIRRAGTVLETRPVIDLLVCVAGHSARSEFTLADRTGMAYQLLIGRNFLKDRILVDSEKSQTVRTPCADAD